MTTTTAVAPGAAQACAVLLDGNGIDTRRLVDTAAKAATSADFADIYVERSTSEAWALDESRIDSGTYDQEQGMAVRAVRGEANVFASADLISGANLGRLLEAIQPGVAHLPAGGASIHLDPPRGEPTPRYLPDSPLALPDATKIALLKAIDARARAADSRVHNVMANINLTHRHMLVARHDGAWQADTRPLYRVSVVVVLRDGTKVETGSDSMGGRTDARTLDEATVHRLADEALRRAASKITARPAPGGTMPVVLGHGWSGILLHEAIGHGLEGDFNRKGQSAFSGRVGERIAPAGVTVVDDGTLDGRRGSITCDDEGTPGACNTLIEDGILQGYMQDLVNAALMGVAPTGNGRRQSYRHQPMPRMTNTYMLNGTRTPEEVIASVDRGLYCKSFGGGSVDITNGNFNFDVDEAYLIRDGQLGECVKGATIIGNGPETMTRMSLVANDLALDPGVGTCGKNGQWVPVGVGQPHCRVDEMLVGGTEL